MCLLSPTFSFASLLRSLCSLRCRIFLAKQAWRKYVLHSNIKPPCSGGLLFFILVSLMIVSVSAESHRDTFFIHSYYIKSIHDSRCGLQIFFNPIPWKSDYIVVVAFKVVDVFTEGSLYGVSAGLIIRLGSLHIGKKFFVGIILEIY